MQNDNVKDVQVAGMLIAAQASFFMDKADGESLSDVVCASLWMGVQMAAKELCEVADGSKGPLEAHADLVARMSHMGFEVEVLEAEHRG